MARKKTTAPATKVVEAVKEAEVKVEEVKAEETKIEEVKVEEVKTEEVKEVKKAPAKKTTAKKAVKKEVKTSVLVQFGGQEAAIETLVENAKKAYEAEGNNVADITDIQIYVKPEEYAAYYVINGVAGRINLF